MLMNNKSREELLKIFGRLVMLAVICFLVSLAAHQAPDSSHFNQQWIDDQAQHNGWQGMLNYLLVATLLISMGLPRQLAAFLAGYAFGFLQGLLLSMLAVSFSCLLTVLLVRVFARPFARHFFSKRVSQLDAFVYEHPLKKAMVLRLLPVGNNMLTNVLAGMSSVAVSPFLLGSVIGYIPQMLVFSLMGKGVLLQSGWKIGLSLALFAFSSLLSWYLYQQYRISKQSPPTIDSLSAGEQR